MKHFFGRLQAAICLPVLFVVAGLSFLPVSPALAASHSAAASTPTLVVNANQVLRPVTHVASGGLYGLGSDSTPADSMVTPLHPRDFVQMAPNGHQLPTESLLPAVTRWWWRPKLLARVQP